MRSDMETISLIGSGNAATHIGHALAKAGHRVNGVFSRTLAAAQALAGVLRCDATDNLEALPEADCYLFAVKDDALPGLAARWGTLHPDSLCLHTAGSVPMDIFEGKVKSYGVLYPMQTFSKTRPVNFHDIPCFIEANNPETLEKVTQLARSVSDQVYVLSSERRRWLHVAAVFACNFSNHCYDIAARLLEKEGIPSDTLLPLIDETAAKIHELPARKAQTGPAVRFDQNVIGRHEQMLADSPVLRQIYELMNRHIHQYAQEND